MNAEYGQDILFKVYVILKEQQTKVFTWILKLVNTASYSIGEIYAGKLNL